SPQRCRSTTRLHPFPTRRSSDLVGGDGTMLGVARRLAPDGVPLVGINHGRLGFITDISLDAWRPALGAILDGKFDAEDRTLITADRKSTRLNSSHVKISYAVFWL